MPRKWIQSADVLVEDDGRIAIALPPELIADARLKVDAAGVTLSAEQVNLDVPGITGGSPGRTLSDVFDAIGALAGPAGVTSNLSDVVSAVAALAGMSVNVAGLNGSAPSLGAGYSDGGTLRIVIATDDPGMSAIAGYLNDGTGNGWLGQVHRSLYDGYSSQPWLSTIDSTLRWCLTTEEGDIPLGRVLDGRLQSLLSYDGTPYLASLRDEVRSYMSNGDGSGLYALFSGGTAKVALYQVGEYPVPVQTGSGDAGSGCIRIVIASDDPNLSAINGYLHDLNGGAWLAQIFNVLFDSTNSGQPWLNRINDTLHSLMADDGDQGYLAKIRDDLRSYLSDGYGSGLYSFFASAPTRVSLASVGAEPTAIETGIGIGGAGCIRVVTADNDPNLGSLASYLRDEDGDPLLGQVCSLLTDHRDPSQPWLQTINETLTSCLTTQDEDRVPLTQALNNSLRSLLADDMGEPELRNLRSDLRAYLSDGEGGGLYAKLNQLLTILSNVWDAEGNCLKVRVTNP